MARRIKPHLWKLVPDDGRVGRRRGITDLACRSTDTASATGGLDDLAEGISAAVRPFLLSRNIDVEVWEDDQGTIRATITAGFRSVARLTCTEVTDAD